MRCILESVYNKRRPSNDPRLIVAELTGEAYRHARWREPTEEETAAVVAELQKIIAERDDGIALLCEVAGITIGAHEGKIDELRAQTAAHFLLKAGAETDVPLVAHWVEVGKERAERAARPPFGML